MNFTFAFYETVMQFINENAMAANNFHVLNQSVGIAFYLLKGI